MEWVLLFGIKNKKNTAKKLSDLAKHYIGDKNPFYGREHNDETKAKISERIR